MRNDLLVGKLEVLADAANVARQHAQLVAALPWCFCRNCPISKLVANIERHAKLSRHHLLAPSMTMEPIICSAEPLASPDALITPPRSWPECFKTAPLKKFCAKVLRGKRGHVLLSRSPQPPRSTLHCARPSKASRCLSRRKFPVFMSQSRSRGSSCLKAPGLTRHARAHCVDRVVGDGRGGRRRRQSQRQAGRGSRHI